MTRSLTELLEHFDSLSESNQRVVIHRLKNRKKKMEKNLELINKVLESYEQRKEKRFNERVEKIRQRYRANSYVSEQEITLSLKRNFPWLFDENGNFKTKF